MTSPSFLAHDDIRVAAILHLAQHAAEYPALDASPLELAVCAMLPNVPSRQVAEAFRLIVADLATAIDYDTRGADAVYDRLGSGWFIADEADEKATKMTDAHRADAQLAACMLVTTSDSLAVS